MTHADIAADALPHTPADFPAFETVEGDPKCGYLLVCDHARNAIPQEYGNLGLPEDQLVRHIAYDIGVEAVTKQLASVLGCPAVLSCYSRLLIDPNRGLDDPTLVMRISDGAVVPGNARIDQAEIDRRVRTYYLPYDAAVREAIERSLQNGIVPILFSIHSFTPMWRGTPRPWHAGVLWDRDDRVAKPFIEALRADPALVVGDNEPYTGELQGDMMNRHGTQLGIPHALLEIRQDLIADNKGVESWVDRLAHILPELSGAENVHTIMKTRG